MYKNIFMLEQIPGMSGSINFASVDPKQSEEGPGNENAVN
jgi:hypothetical protein